MATGKRYYWMKLKESFMTSDTIDYFMSLPDGANYVVLYQMLCLKTINTGGRMSRQIGEVIIPFDIEKIRRDCKWFSADTIRVALQLYQSFGLIYTDSEDGTLVLADYDSLVGSETDYALQKKRQMENREAKALPPAPAPETAAEPDGETVETGVDIGVDIGVENFHTDIRDKILENRDKSKDTRDRGKEFKQSSSGEDDLGDRKLTPRPPSQRKQVMDAWNELASYGIASIRAINDNTERAKRLRARIGQYGVKGVLDAINAIRESSFLQGKNEQNWVITFDWFICPNNFPKVLEGNYIDREEKPRSRTANTMGNMRSAYAMLGGDSDE